MAYAIECFFNEEANIKINRIISLFKENGINTDNILHPHVSLAVYNDSLDIDLYTKIFEDFFSNEKSFKLQFTNFDLFSLEKSVLFLALKNSSTLFDLHSRFHNTMNKFIPNESHYYTPGNWFPHCTVSVDMTRDMVDKSIKYLHEIRLPLEVTVERIGLIEFFPPKNIVTIPLD